MINRLLSWSINYTSQICTPKGYSDYRICLEKDNFSWPPFLAPLLLSSACWRTQAISTETPLSTYSQIENSVYVNALTLKLVSPNNAVGDTQFFLNEV